jgi:amino-acid N-acetyltransferase
LLNLDDNPDEPVRSSSRIVIRFGMLAGRKTMQNSLALDYSPVEVIWQPTIQKASTRHIQPLLRLINGYAAKGIMLPRTEFEMAENIRDFTLVMNGDSVVGCGALHFYSPTTAEIRSLAVDSNTTRRGIGRTIVEALEREARECHLHSIFALTTVAGFFRKLGFAEVERGEFPLKVWKDCIRCAKIACCHEKSVVKYLVDSPVFNREPQLIMPTVRQ